MVFIILGFVFYQLDHVPTKGVSRITQMQQKQVYFTRDKDSI
jgi:hypothetical protein